MKPDGQKIKFNVCCFGIKYKAASDNNTEVVFLKKIIRTVFAVGMLAAAVLAAVIFLNVPDLSEEKITNISQTLVICDKNGTPVARLNSGQNRQSISEIPENVRDALIACEDVRFYEHNGIDIKRIFGAMLADIKSGSYSQGASTITQQLIKNSHLTNEKTLMRKAKEAILALELERRYSKDEILAMYLNFVYFGRGAYGIQTAAQTYFAKDASELSVPQAATLIGALKAPNKYAPHINYEASLKRRNTVIECMNKNGFISDEEFSAYSAEPIVIADEAEQADYGYFTDYVLEEGAAALGITVADFLGGGYTVYTTQDSGLQTFLQELYADGDLFPDKDVESAAVVIDNKSGGIAAMVGGRKHEGMRLFNRATALRQPGSCIKPILVYAPALENGSITASTLLSDRRTDFDGYSPTNFHDVYYGSVTVRRALALSLNVPAVSLLNENGIEYSKRFAEKLGIKFDDDDKYLALALGGMKYGTSPLALACAYRSFASGGSYTEGRCIEKITDSDGNTVYEYQKNEKNVMKDSTAFIITDILCDVSKQSNNPLHTLKYPVACKTGTVGCENGYSDAWSTSYTSDSTVCVWMGFDRTDSEHFLNENITGSTLPSLIAEKLYGYLFEHYGCTPFTVPQSVKKVTLDSYALSVFGELCVAGDSTAMAYRTDEYFTENTAPENESIYWKTPLQAKDIRVQLNELRQAEIKLTASQSYCEYLVYKGERLIGKVSGSEDSVLTVTDTDYREGDSYCVLPRHTSVYENGMLLEGEKSEEIKP